MTKYQLTLTDQEAMAVSSEASQLGYDIARYLKFVVAKITENFVKRTSINTILSDQAEADAIETLTAFRRGELRKIKSADEL